MGKLMNSLRKTGADVTNTLKKELEAEERELKTPQESTDDIPESADIPGDTPSTDTGQEKQDQKNE